LEDSDGTRVPPSERSRPVDEAVVFALGHRIRLDALAILAEGAHSPSEIAKLLGEDRRVVSNHLRKLFEAGCIEEVSSKTVRNATERFFQALTMPYISDETYRAMTPDERREIIALIIQSIMAEVMAAFLAGKLETDEDLWLAWDALELDEKGRRELAKELEVRYERFLAIKEKSAKRRAKSGEASTPTVVALMGFPRSRHGRPEKGYFPAD
jgi:DNA-binding transcriptional ArsR family regulator